MYQQQYANDTPRANPNVEVKLPLKNEKNVLNLKATGATETPVRLYMYSCEQFDEEKKIEYTIRI